MTHHSLYLDGQFVPGESSLPVINPATGKPFATIGLLSRASITEAIGRAHTAFGSWRKHTARERSDWLQKLAAEMERRAEEFARTITTENGKPLAQSRTETSMSIDHVRWFAEEAKRSYGRIIPHSIDQKRNLVVKSPVGVVGAIGPWNFPLMLGVRKVAPALAAGCTVLLKPARQTPLASVLFAECVDAIGLPANVFQLVQGAAAEIGAEFLENRWCRKITFTGSTEVGQVLIRGAAAQLKLLSLELGGQAPCIVFDDADLSHAVEGVLMAKTRNTGQSCIAANRIYVQRGIYERFLSAFVDRMRTLKVGDGFAPGVEIGPLIDDKAVQKAAEHVADAVRRGGRLLCGGKRGEREGFFFAPTVLSDVPADSLCCSEETFAPVAPIAPFDTEQEVIERANASPYGLSAYAFTQDLSRAFRLMEELEAGTIGINDGVPTATPAPFGGVKMSGWGRELGVEGLDAFLETKHVSIHL